MNRTITCLALTLFAVGCADDSGSSEAQLQAAGDPSAQYRVVVSLASAGAGIDRDTYEEIHALYGGYDVELTPDLFTWGLEGERNLCFTLADLNAQAQGLFVADLEAIATSGAFVTVHENAACNVIAE